MLGNYSEQLRLAAAASLCLVKTDQVRNFNYS